MVNLTALRTEVKEDLEAAGIPTPGWADNTLPAPPCAIVSLAEPYLSPATEETGSLDCRFVAHLAVEVVAGRGPSEQVAAELDSLIRTAVLALITGEYTGRVPGDGIPQLVDVRPYIAEESMTVGAYVSVNFPINMKES